MTAVLAPRLEMAPLDDVDTAWVAGAESALRDAYDRWAGPIHTFCVRRLGPDDAVDATQEVFVSAWRSRHGFDPARGALVQWLFGVARNVCNSHTRANARQPMPVEEVTDLVTISVDPTQEGLTDALVVRQALSELPERQRAVIEAAFIGGRTHHEVAELLELPLGTVKSDIRRGLLQLRAVVGLA